MKRKKLVSLKTQIAWSFFPYMGMAIVWFCGAYNITREQEKKYFHLICYMFSFFVPAIVLMIPLGLILTNLVGRITEQVIVALVGGYLVCLVMALCGVWAQKRIVKKITAAENDAYIA